MTLRILSITLFTWLSATALVHNAAASQDVASAGEIGKSNPISPAGARVVSIPPVSCIRPDPSFSKFLDAFSENQGFQRSRVLVPLLLRSGEYTLHGATIQILDAVEIENLAVPLFRSKRERKNISVYQSVLFVTERYAEVFHGRSRADFDQVLYKFRKIDRCWFLEEMHDLSL